jgi:hypothetical protein
MAATARVKPTGYGCMRGTFELLVSEDEARGADPKSWGTQREWRGQRRFSTPTRGFAATRSTT